MFFRRNTPPPNRAEPTIPDFPEHLVLLCRRVASRVLEQVSEFEGKPMNTVPNYPTREQVLIASYSWGYLSGYFQITGEDRIWWRHEAASELAIGGCILNVATSVFGNDAESILSGLPQLDGRRPADDILFLEKVGGTDGIALAKGEPSQWSKGGLHQYLEHNVTPVTAHHPAGQEAALTRILLEGAQQRLAEEHRRKPEAAELLSLESLQERIDAARARRK